MEFDGCPGTDFVDGVGVLADVSQPRRALPCGQRLRERSWSSRSGRKLFISSFILPIRIVVQGIVNVKHKLRVKGCTKQTIINGQHAGSPTGFVSKA